MKKFLVSFIFIFIFSQISFADVVYTTSNGSMGLIEISDSLRTILKPSQYTRSGSDLFVSSFWNGDSYKIILVDRVDRIDRNEDSSISGDRAFIFNTNNLSVTENSERLFLAGIHNTSAIDDSPNGRSIFAASKNDGSIVEFMTDSIEPRKSYIFSDDINEISTKKLISTPGSIYSLFKVGDSKSVVIHFDGTLEENASFASADIDINANDMTMFGKNYDIAIAHEKGIRLFSTALDLRNVSENVEAICSDGNEGFYFITHNASSDILFRWNGSSLRTINSGESGELCQLKFDEDEKILAAIMSNKILIFNCKNNSASLIREYNYTEIGGYPVSITFTTISDSEDSNSNSSCNFYNKNLIYLLLILPLIFMSSHDIIKTKKQEDFVHGRSYSAQ